METTPHLLIAHCSIPWNNIIHLLSSQLKLLWDFSADLRPVSISTFPAEQSACVVLKKTSNTTWPVSVQVFWTQRTKGCDTVDEMPFLNSLSISCCWQNMTFCAPWRSGPVWGVFISFNSFSLRGYFTQKHRRSNSFVLIHIIQLCPCFDHHPSASVFYDFYLVLFFLSPPPPPSCPPQHSSQVWVWVVKSKELLVCICC